MAESYTPSGSSASYTVPELTDPADAPQAFRDFSDSIADPNDTLTIIGATDHVTLEANDDGAMLACDTVVKGGNIEVTVPANSSVALPVGFVVALSNLGGGGHQVKIKKGTGVVIQDQGFLQVEDYRTSVLVKVSTDFWLVQAGSATYTPPAQVGLEGIGDWATVTATTGSPTTGTYTDGNGVDWKYYQWAGAGSVTTTEGVVDALLGGAGTKSNNNNHGDGGDVNRGVFPVPAGTSTITVGLTGQTNPASASDIAGVDGAHAGGGPGGNGWGAAGRQGVDRSTSGWAVDGSCSGNPAGIVDDITNVAVQYGQGCARPNQGAGANPTTPGSGGVLGTTNNKGENGVVIIRVPSQFAQA